MSDPVKGEKARRIDLKDLAERCTIAGNAVEMSAADAKLFGECAEAFHEMSRVLESLPLVVRNNRAAQHMASVEGCASALEAVAIEYERGTKGFATPQGALRQVANALRASLPRPEERPKPELVKGMLQ